VSGQLSRKFPNALDRIQVGAVGGQEVETHSGPPRGKKRAQRSSVVIARIVEDQNQATVARTMPQELAQELSERHGAESRLLQRNQLSVPEVHRSEQRPRLSRGSMEQHRVGILGRNPKYSIFTRRQELLLFMHIDDLDRAWDELAKDPVNQRWQKEMGKPFEPVPDQQPGERFAMMKEVFYMK